MKRKYEEFYNISMDDIKYMFPKSFMQNKMLNSIQSLGELFEFFDNPSLVKSYIEKK